MVILNPSKKSDLPRKVEKVPTRGLLIIHTCHFFTEEFFSFYIKALSLPLYLQVISSTTLHYLHTEQNRFSYIDPLPDIFQTARVFF